MRRGFQARRDERPYRGAFRTTQTTSSHNQIQKRSDNVNLDNPKVVSQAELLAARKELLTREQELTRRYDALCEARRPN